MITYDLYNPTRTPRIIYDGIEGSQRALKLPPGARLQNVALADNVVDMLRSRTDDIEVFVRGQRSAMVSIALKPAPPGEPKPKVIIDGMYGIGDNLHQRAPIRELMKTHEVWLRTCHAAVWHDLVPQGLHLVLKPTNLRAQSKIIARERESFPHSNPPPDARGIKIWYKKEQIDRCGTIADSLMYECGIAGKPDWSLPLKPEWIAEARALIASWKTDKPIMIYRPIVQRRDWNGANRNPEPDAYSALYRAIREKFFVVSIADLQQGQEWIVGQEEDADIKIHDGSLTFETMAGLFGEASLVFCNAGFAPVLAQAVGTPSIVVYGGRESFKTTQAAGAHLAPTLGINPDNPCDCHSERHQCNTHITLPPALEKVTAFAALYAQPKKRILIFATTYVDSDDRMKLTDQWLTLTIAKNPDCDILIVDSASPRKPFIDEAKHGKFEPYVAGRRHARMLYDFGDNVGHLSRKGRDGWGRAFCFGLQAAVDCGYDYVAHVEGDSLLRVPIRPLCKDDVKAASIPVIGTARTFPNWVETGLMIFSTEYIRSSNFIAQYDWPNRRERPTPEIIVKGIIGDNLKMLALRGQRSDKQQITHDTVLSLDLDWITHCHSDIWCYDRFLDAALGREVMPTELRSEEGALDPKQGSNNSTPATMPHLKLNLGCGTNKLSGWENHDAEVDITKALPYGDNSAEFIFCEHCVEHVLYPLAIDFFREALRVLAPGGTLRITVPSLEQIYRNSTPEYWKFTTKWQPDATRRGAMANIIYQHGHRTCWTASLLEATLFFAGFENLKPCAVGASDHPELRNVEGHGKVIGEEFNAIESLCFEATKPAPPERRVAVVVGGAKSVWDDVAKAKALVNGRADYFVINDMIPRWDGEMVAVTLHPNKLAAWLAERGDKPPPKAIWGHRPDSHGVTHHIEEWRGSSGLHAVRAAREMGYECILLCGVPMTDEPHFVREIPWVSVMSFRKGWERRKPEIAPYVRSFSGWTAEQFGVPDKEFVR